MYDFGIPETAEISFNTRIHAILTQDERDAIVNALDFYYRYQRGTIEYDNYEQARLAAREFGIDRLDELATKIATLN